MTIYQDIIVDHYRNPRNKGVLEDATISESLKNYSCGDTITVYLNVQDDTITDVRFKGSGCAISQAAASILLENIKGKSINEVKKLTYSDIQELLGVKLSPARVKCAELALKAVQKGVTK
ncbi:SUF system NifU family Fe-S cluster assembly protein [Patescibacteria group bacterium]|nr:SUF system NifU family Fe-S cluster assembly protein [Patescibacteria group bacterium]